MSRRRARCGQTYLAPGSLASCRRLAGSAHAPRTRGSDPCFAERTQSVSLRGSGREDDRGRAREPALHNHLLAPRVREEFVHRSASAAAAPAQLSAGVVHGARMEGDAESTVEVALTCNVIAHSIVVSLDSAQSLAAQARERCAASCRTGTRSRAGRRPGADVDTPLK